MNSRSGTLMDFQVLCPGHHLKLPPSLKQQTHIWRGLSGKVQLTMPHVGRGLEHGCQGHLPQETGPGHLQLPEAWTEAGGGGGGRACCMALRMHWTFGGSLQPVPYPRAHPSGHHPPAYPGGPSAAANSEPAARPRRHWTAGALPPGPGSAEAPLPPELPAVGTGREDTARRWATAGPGSCCSCLGREALLDTGAPPPTFPRPPGPTKPCSLKNPEVLQLDEQLPLTAQTGKLRPKRIKCLPSQLPLPPRCLQTH